MNRSRPCSPCSTIVARRLGVRPDVLSDGIAAHTTLITTDCGAYSMIIRQLPPLSSFNNVTVDEVF